MPQLVQAWMRSGSTYFGRELQRRGHFLRRLDLVRGDVDGADQHRLVGQELHQLGRHVALPAFQRDLLDPAAVERREGVLVLTPALAQRLLPLDVGLDAVAVADVHRGRALQPLGRLLQRRHAPFDGLVEIDVEGGLVELDDVDAELLEVLAPPGSGARRRRRPSSRGRRSSRRPGCRSGSSARAG